LKGQVVEVFREGKLIKKIPCSTGIKPGSTPVGKFITYSRKEINEWVEDEGTEIKYYYATKFNNNIYFHSLVEGNHILVDQWIRLYETGKPSSMGCVRISKEDAKWHDGLPQGIEVEITQDELRPN